MSFLFLEEQSLFHILLLKMFYSLCARMCRLVPRKQPWEEVLKDLMVGHILVTFRNTEISLCPFVSDPSKNKSCWSCALQSLVLMNNLLYIRNISLLIDHTAVSPKHWHIKQVNVGWREAWFNSKPLMSNFNLI